MNKYLLGVLAFVTGAGIGSYVTYKVLDVKYADILDEEVDKLKDMYKRKMEAVSEENISEDRQESYEKIINNEQYLSEDKQPEHTNEDIQTVLEENKDPYMIAPENYGENPDYEMVSLTLYKDGVLCDENDEEIKDIEDLLGHNLEYFGAYDDNSLFVRNDTKKCDYEIIKVEDMRYPVSTVVEDTEEEDVE